ncbi:hypothetical protein Kpho02_75970 [Kitasatospora phosalacinea]|uniref:Uncharacterized protein n=1 Tax=Kitasatospora phosalacinea TaxID=2065 RepID=A0A9W6QDQ1_9ACTN|nr:hypothetical protein [Kitasatospora phosalacinea]GLW75300.1 hypothetical protein Kpho02_75970 [Kitasatospora phosalacinea]
MRGGEGGTAVLAALRPHGFANPYLCDVGVLPGAPGVSPRGTIMSYAHETVARHPEST